MHPNASEQRLAGARSRKRPARQGVHKLSLAAKIQSVTKAGHNEATDCLDLVTLLSEPEVRLLMRADRVDEHELVAMLHAISARRQKDVCDSQHRDSGDHSVQHLKYRPGVGIMLLNRAGNIFVARRNDIAGEAWQMPQGGIDREEAPREAVWRELEEELGTDKAEIIAESKRWFCYDVPEKVASKAWGGQWMGQRQKWFAMLFKGDDSDINLASEHAEFDAWRWVAVEDLPKLAVPFKRQLYMDVLGEFSTIFRD